MNCAVILCVFFSVVASAVIPEEAEAKVVKYENSNDGFGNYKFSFETSNGITREETGHLENVGTDDEHMVVEGSYSYIDVEGNPVVVKYTADKNGYQIVQPEFGLPPETAVAAGLPGSVVATLLGK